MKITPELAELVGVIMGDGYIYSNHGTHQIGIVGSPKTDREYFGKLKELIKNVWGKDVKIKIGGRGLRMIISSKAIAQQLINNFEIPSGRKSGKIIICDSIASDWNLVKHTIRGLVDTDGSVFVSKKPGVEKYPTIELNSINRNLILQLMDLLKKQGFRVSNIHKRISKGFCTGKFSIAYKVALYGQTNLKKWINEVGFSNPYKQARALSYLRK